MIVEGTALLGRTLEPTKGRVVVEDGRITAVVRRAAVDDVKDVIL